MADTLLTKLGIPQNVLDCKSFDEILSRKLFETLSEPQQIAIYNYFNLQEQEQEKAQAGRMTLLIERLAGNGLLEACHKRKRKSHQTIQETWQE